MDSVGIRAIPIGMENSYFRLNGVPNNFLKLENIRCAMRDIEVLASFRCKSNPSVREKLKTVLSEYNVVWLEPSFDIENYLATLSRSKFVLSPMGNGLDCHRTWEALYAGSIPVVLEGTLPLNLTSKLPIHVTDTWESFLHMSTDQKDCLAEELLARPLDLAYFESWATLLRT